MHTRHAHTLNAELVGQKLGTKAFAAKERRNLVRDVIADLHSNLGRAF